MKNTQPAKMDITCMVSEGESVIQVTRVQWRMDMTNDRLETGQPIQILTLIDMLTKQSPAVEIQKTFTRQDVVKSDLTPLFQPLVVRGFSIIWA
jgi:hypothetical protein